MGALELEDNKNIIGTNGSMFEVMLAIIAIDLTKARIAALEDGCASTLSDLVPFGDVDRGEFFVIKKYNFRPDDR